MNKCFVPHRPGLKQWQAASRDRWGINCYIFQRGLKKPSSGVDRNRCCHLNIKPVKWNVLCKEVLIGAEIKHCASHNQAHVHLRASAWHVIHPESWDKREQGRFDPLLVLWCRCIRRMWFCFSIWIWLQHLSRKKSGHWHNSFSDYWKMQSKRCWWNFFRHMKFHFHSGRAG